LVIPQPVAAAAPTEPAAPSAVGGGHQQPAALTDWLGSNPPLPPAFVYFAVFASGLAIVLSMRRELGLAPRRRRRF
jgi:hypothetical protein